MLIKITQRLYYLRDSLVEAPGIINTTEELRRSERLQGLPPEFGLLLDQNKVIKNMPLDSTDQNGDAGSNTVPNNSVQVPILTYQLPRNPCIFSGDGDQDVSRWLKDFQRIAVYNHWDDQMCLANVIFYLAGTARQWFDNNEDSFTNWTTLQNALENTFCRTDDIKSQAERLLLTRAQKIGEVAESYIQDVLALCRKVNPSMSEDEKVAHLLKGISEDLYQILVAQNYQTVDDFVKRCRQIESLRRKRITRPRFQRLPNVSTMSAEADIGDIRSMIRIIVQEEIKKILPEVSCCTNNECESPTDVASVVREEIMEALAPLTGPKGPIITPRRSVPNGSRPRREARNSVVPQRKTDVWRTTDNVPLCYHCGRPGHVLRYCRERRRVFTDARNIRTSNTRRDMDTDSLRSFDENYEQPIPSSFRSNSPYPRRSFNRRQSQSPMRRSSRSPRRSNEGN